MALVNPQMFDYLDKKIQEVQSLDEIAKPRKRPFLQHIHYFRGFAIINIVMIHLLFPYLGEHVKLFKTPGVIVDLLFLDSTLYFVLISGFLFSYLAHKIRVKSFYEVKIKNVVLPYIIITFLVTLFKNRSLVTGLDIAELLEVFLKNVLLGSVLVPYWYIPFITIVFFVSPFFLSIREHTFRNITLVALFLPLLGTRPGIVITPVHFIYYVPVYMLGMLIARNYEAVLDLVDRYKVLLYILILGSSLPAAYLLWLPEDSFAIQGNLIHSLFYMQKMSISLLLLRFLKQFDEKKINWLDYLAVYSFSIYFLHTIVQYGVQKLMYYPVLRPYIDQAPILYILFVGILILFITLFISIGLKKILGKYSRMLIGT